MKIYTFLLYVLWGVIIIEATKQGCEHLEKENWDLEEKSIERAHDTGHWYVTGTSTIEGPNGIELEFEFEFCEGYLDGIIGTPYNEDEHRNHGIEFD